MKNLKLVLNRLRQNEPIRTSLRLLVDAIITWASAWLISHMGWIAQPEIYTAVVGLIGVVTVQITYFLNVNLFGDLGVKKK